jgi:hypothetical protein
MMIMNWHRDGHCVQDRYKVASAAWSFHLNPHHLCHLCKSSLHQILQHGSCESDNGCQRHNARSFMGRQRIQCHCGRCSTSYHHQRDRCYRQIEVRAAICGSDLHIYRGTNPGPATPWILGHEGIGYVSEVGEGVGSLAVGDSVVIPFATAEGHIHDSLTTQMYGGYGNGGGMGGTQCQL